MIKMYKVWTFLVEKANEGKTFNDFTAEEQGELVKLLVDMQTKFIKTWEKVLNTRRR